jgi:hypothetical protein
METNLRCRSSSIFEVDEDAEKLWIIMVFSRLLRSVKLCQLINMIYNSAERKKKQRDRSNREYLIIVLILHNSIYHEIVVFIYLFVTD